MFGCRAPTQTGQTITLSGTLAGQLAFDGVRVTIPDLRMDTPEGRIVLRGFVDAGGPKSESRPARTSGRGPCASGATDPGQPDSSCGVRRFRQHPRRCGARRDSHADRSPRQRWISPQQAAKWRTDRSRAFASSPGHRSTGTASGFISSTSRRHRAPCKRAARLPCQERGIGAAASLSSWDGRMSTWIARCQAPAMRFPRRSARARRVVRSCALIRPTTAWTTCCPGSRLMLRVKLQPIRDAARRGASLALGGQAQLLLKDGSWSARHSLTASSSTASLAGTINGRFRPERNDSTLGGSTRLRVDDVGAAVAALSDAGVSIPEQYSRGLKGSLDSMLEPTGTITRPAVRATLAAREVSAADWPTGTVDAVPSADREGMRVHRLDAQSRPGTAQRFRRLRLERPGQRPVRRVRQRHRRAGSQVSGDAARDVWQRAPRRPRRGNGRRAACAGDAHSRRRGDRGNVHRTRRRRHRTRRQAGSDRCGRAGSRRARLERISTLPAPIATRPKPASSGRRSPLPFLPICGTNSRSARASSPAACELSGMLSSPLEVAAKADLDELEVTLKDTRIKLQRSATLDVSPDRITAEHVDLVVGQTTRVQMSGTLATTVAAAPLRLQANGPLADLIAIAGPLLPPETRISADGTLSLDLSVAGTMRAPEPSGSLTAARRHSGLRRSAAGDGCGAHGHRRSHARRAADARRDVADGKTLGPGPAAPATAASANPIRLVRGCRNGSLRFQTSLAQLR